MRANQRDQVAAEERDGGVTGGAEDGERQTTEHPETKNEIRASREATTRESIM